MYRPLADRIRPSELDDVVGQEHLLGKNGILRNIIESGIVPNMIFYGPSGVGKTTVANIIAAETNRMMYKLNATTAGIADIKAIISNVGGLAAVNGILLYLDEIQYFNKKQQQSLLEFIENGSITLIASTTENPYFYIYNAILSRCTVFEFKPISAAEMLKAVKRAIDIENPSIEIEDGVPELIASSCGGDVRKALNAVELLVASAETSQRSITLENSKLLTQRSSNRYDRDGDMHYDILSALQKSIRGSDPDAAVYYLSRLLKSGDILSACRRLLVIASEDIGLAYPQAISVTKSCVDSALQLGLPEAALSLSEAAIFLATAPKSNSSAKAIWSAMEEGDFPIPDHLRDSHYAGSEKLGHGLTYMYPHDYPDHYVAQNYLPDSIRNKVYYEFGTDKNEQSAKEYWDIIKKKSL